MRKPVYLSPNQLHVELLTRLEDRKIQQEFDKHIIAVWDAKLPELEEHKQLEEILQAKYRKILSITRPRMNQTDVYGHPILSPSEYLEKLGTMDERNAVAFKNTITAPVTFTRHGQPHVVNVDYNLAPFLQRLADSGYGTGQSDSGTLTDHPNYRYVQDCKQGLYTKGECIYFNKQGSGAYLTFWKPEAEAVKEAGDVICTQEQIDDIRHIASEQGWIVEDTDIFFQPSIRLGLPFTYDGCSKAEILKEASDRTNEAFPGLYQKDFLRWLEARTPIEHQVWREHKGVVMYTDEMILSRWGKLTAALEAVYKKRLILTEEKERQERMFARITDVTIFPGGDGYWRIKCKIDGRSRMSERIADHEMKAINNGTPAKVFAAQKYEEVLNAPHEELQKGIKR